MLDSNRQKDNSFFSGSMDHEIFASTLEDTVSSNEGSKNLLGKRKYQIIEDSSDDKISKRAKISESNEK